MNLVVWRKHRLDSTPHIGSWLTATTLCGLKFDVTKTRWCVTAPYPCTWVGEDVPCVRCVELAPPASAASPSRSGGAAHSASTHTRASSPARATMSEDTP